jgi:Cytochrome c oxidase subunit IV
MREEARLFMRTSVYALIVAIVYWFVSYEVAGTVLLVILGLAAAALTAMLPAGGKVKPVRLPIELATFDENENPAFEVEEVPLPTLSAMPLFVAGGSAAIALGLVFGAWLWLPGSLTVLGAAWRWVTELD